MNLSGRSRAFSGAYTAATEAPAAWPWGLHSSPLQWRLWHDSRETALAQGLQGLWHREGHELAALRARLRPALLETDIGLQALGVVSAVAQQRLGWRVHSPQALAAWFMLQGHLAEMATGEGKTLATGLAAATAALAGLRVHVMTANDYLVRRDRAQLAPLFDALGLSSAAVAHDTVAAERAGAYRHDIVYVTAREVVFDHLRDHLGPGAERDLRLLRARGLAHGEGVEATQPVLLPLQQAFIDEADSLLLDEASVPFVMSAPGGAPDAYPLQLARGCALRLPPQAFRLQPARRNALLTDEGQARVMEQLAPHLLAGGPLWPARLALELVRSALVAEHLLKPGRDYALRAGELVLIDEITGRVAEGRRWQHPLQAMVELKEGLAPSPPMVTAAQITYQRWFPRYERLGGSSGTLREARAELQALYQRRCVTVPRVRASKLQRWPARLFLNPHARAAACVQRIRQMQAQGRPVLVGTESVQASEQLSQALLRAGITHTVLNALQDADENQVIARAGVAGAVTVATNMAGRGTDIVLSAPARAAGGLHVILAVCNRSRRIDRQLAGRAARQGDPGSAESLLSLDDLPIRQGLPAWLRRALAACADARGELPRGSAAGVMAWVQRRCEWRDWAHRRELALQDERQARSLAFGRAQE